MYKNAKKAIVQKLPEIQNQIVVLEENKLPELQEQIIDVVKLSAAVRSEIVPVLSPQLNNEIEHGKDGDDNLTVVKKVTETSH